MFPTDTGVGPAPPSLIRTLPPSGATGGPPDGQKIKKNPATTYSPTQLPEQYHRHRRA